jgi:hypothetical protein
VLYCVGMQLDTSCSEKMMFGPKGKEVKGGCRQLNNYELHNFCLFLYIIGVIKSRTVICRGTWYIWVRGKGVQGFSDDT